MPRRDEGHEETERVLADLEKRITEEYSTAQKEIQAKLDDYMKRYETKNRIKYEAMKAGKITEAKYKEWQIGQLAMGKRWEEMKDSVAQDLTNASQIAKSITAGYMPEVYAINHNYGTFQVEKASKVDTSYTLYDRDSAERMFKDTDFYKGPGKKVQKAINEGKQKAWDKKQIQSVMFQGIVQGESIGDIATRIARKTCDSDRKAAIRNARTITTGIENAGRVDSYKRAEDMGINLMQEWMASLDFRTRHEHRVLDGMRVPVGEQFHVEGYDIEYPGDPSAEPEMVYNCRCTLVPVLEGFERDADLRRDDHLGDMSYDEWKESHEEYSDPITKQDEIAEMMRESYIQDYRYLEGENPYTPIAEKSEPNYIEDISEPKRAEVPEDIEKELDAFMKKNVNTKTEHYMAIDKDGNVIFDSGSGGKRNVSVPKYIDEQMEGGYSVHNHPAKAVYSPEDVKNYEKYGEHGFVVDSEGNKYMLYNTNPVSKYQEVENARTEEEVRELLPFYTAYDKAFNQIEDEIIAERRAYGKELMATESDPKVRTEKMKEWMEAHDAEKLKVEWLEENAEQYGFIFKKESLYDEPESEKTEQLPLETVEDSGIINISNYQSKLDRYIEDSSNEEEKEYLRTVFDGERQYKESSTIEEAKSYLKTLGISTSDYDNVNLGYANNLNKILTDYYNTFGNLNKSGYLDEIRIVPKLSSVAGYQPNYHAVLLQKKDTSTKNILSKLEKDAQSEKVLGWWSTGDSGTVIRHELGHAIHHMYTDAVTGGAFGNTVVKSNEITKLRKEFMSELGIDKYNGSNEELEIINKAGEKFSYYALRNDGEFVAEAVAEYMAGNPRETARRVVEILIGG